MLRHTRWSTAELRSAIAGEMIWDKGRDSCLVFLYQKHRFLSVSVSDGMLLFVFWFPAVTAGDSPVAPSAQHCWTQWREGVLRQNMGILCKMLAPNTPALYPIDGSCQILSKDLCWDFLFPLKSPALLKCIH